MYLYIFPAFIFVMYLSSSIPRASVPLSLSAPQLEAGRNVTPYQATDEALSYTDDYGA